MTKTDADTLVGRWGTADELLPYGRDGEGVLDLGAVDWQRDVVVSKVKFTRARLQRARVDVNFVDCTFEKCEFDSVQATGRFWGAGDRWDDCSFTDVKLRDVISPGNAFSHCSFTRVELVEYAAHETTFDNCMFEDVLFESFRAPKATASGKPFAKVPENSVTFRRCTFLRPVFRLCSFKHVAFEDCVVRTPVVDRSDFTGAIGNPPWWSAQPPADLFMTFLDEFLARIEKRVGAGSAAYTNFSSYVDRYKSGATTSKDFSESLFRPDVPDREIDEIEEDMDELTRKFRGAFRA